MKFSLEVLLFCVVLSVAIATPKNTKKHKKHGEAPKATLGEGEAESKCPPCPCEYEGGGNPAGSEGDPAAVLSIPTEKRRFRRDAVEGGAAPECPVCHCEQPPEGGGGDDGDEGKPKKRSKKHKKHNK